MLEVDGLLLNSTVLVVNEAKSSPKVEDVKKLVGSLKPLGKLLEDPESFCTKPAEVKGELVTAGVRRVVGVLSGFNFSAEVEDACKAAEIHAVLTTGEGFAVGGQA